MSEETLLRQDAGGELPFQVWSEDDMRYLNVCPKHVDTPAVDCIVCEPVDGEHPAAGLPIAEVPFAARNIVNQLADLWNVPVDVRQSTAVKAEDFVAGFFPTPPIPAIDRAALAALAERWTWHAEPTKYSYPEANAEAAGVDIGYARAAEELAALLAGECACGNDADVTPAMRTETGQHLTGCPMTPRSTI